MRRICKKNWFNYKTTYVSSPMPITIWWWSNNDIRSTTYSLKKI